MQTQNLVYDPSIDSQKVSNYSWLLSFLIIILGSRILGVWDIQGAFESSVDLDPSEEGIKDKITFLFIFSIAAYGLVKRQVNWRDLIIKNIHLIILFLYMFISITWSAYPTISLKRFIKSLGLVGVVLIILTETNPLFALRISLERALAFLLISSLFLILFVPHYGLGYLGQEKELTWVGITGHKNLLGQLSCIGSIFYLWKIITTGYRLSIQNFLLLAISLVLLVGSNSMTSILAFGIAFSFLIFTQIKIKAEYTTIAYIYLIVMGYILFVIIKNLSTDKSFILTIFDIIGRDLTFTNRRDLWEDVINIASQRHFLGMGYDAFWLGKVKDYIWNIYIFHPYQSHNGYIDIYATLGVVGLVLVVIVIITSIIKISTQFIKNHSLASIRMAFLLAILFFNLSESSICRTNSFLWIFFLLSSLNGLDK